MRDCVRMCFATFCSVSGMASVFPEIQLNWRQEIANVLLSYLRDSVTHSKPGRKGAVKCMMWLLVWVCAWV